ncbi:MAG: hypothetical protein ACR2JI_02075 [Mycobacterium sp.]
MATRTKPLMTAAALVSAAAVAVATPALAPSVASSTSPALSSANVNLANFADVLSIPASEWNNIFYTGWGGAIGQINIDPETNFNDYWLPNCNYDCTIPGVGGIAYLALDALINGDGTGYDNASEWPVSAVNYYFEGGLATAIQWVIEKPFLGEPYTTPGPLYNPQIANLIALTFQGGYALTTLYVTGLSALAQAAQAVPYIGQYLYRGIASYVGLAFQTIDSTYDYNTYAGIPGVLRYIGGVITTGGNSNPYPLVQDPAPASVAAKAPAAVTAASVAASAQTATQSATETATAAVSNVPAVSVADTKAAVASTEAASNESASATSSDATETSASTAVAESVAAAAPTTKPADASVKSRKRPVRDAVAKVAKSVASAASGASSSAAGADSSAGAAG